MKVIYTLIITLRLSLYASSLSNSPIDRRSLFESTAACTLGGGVAFLTASSPKPALAVGEEGTTVSLAVPKSKSVVVLGANGGTGRECVNSLLKAGRKCVATSRTGVIDVIESGVQSQDLVKSGVADVTSFETLDTLLSEPDIGAVIFAASASTKGGDAVAVDKLGVLNAAKACIQNNIPRLVIVSSGTVTRPDSAVYKLLNFVGKGIMEAKIQGEDAVREMYAQADCRNKGLGYTVIRPGGLTTGESGGASILELNQGDNKSGRLSRADVAELCVNCLDYASTFDTTFECYETVTAKPVESVGLSNIMKSTDPTAFVSGKERTGNSWSELFEGLEKDC